VLTAESEATFSNKAKDYKCQIGDAFTNLSASAIKLTSTGEPHSETWTRDGVEDPKILIEILAREFVNILSKPVLRINGLVKQRPDPTAKFDYDGKKWIISSLGYDDSLDLWEIEILNLD